MTAYLYIPKVDYNFQVKFRYNEKRDMSRENNDRIQCSTIF